MSIVNTKNAAHLAKFGMDSAITTAFLASAVIAIGIATKAIAISSLPASLGFFGALATPWGITILLGLTAYFALSAFASFQQLQENRDLKANINAQTKKIEDVEASIKGQAENIKQVEVSVGVQAKEIRQAKASIETQAEQAVQLAITEKKLVAENAMNSAIESCAAKADVEELTNRVKANEDALSETLKTADLEAQVMTLLENDTSAVTQHFGSKYAPIQPTLSDQGH